MTMTSRRQFLTQTSAALLGLGTSVGRIPGDVRDRQADIRMTYKDMITPAAQRAIDQGITFLAERQHGDGSFGERQYKGNVAITSLAAMAMMAGGAQPGRGPRGGAVSRALRFVLDQEDAKVPGFLYNPSASAHGPMYSHGFGTLFLGEVQGMVHEEKLRTKLREVLERAVKLILTSQNREGGWRYQPRAADADISVTICQIMALRSARNAGLVVPKEQVDRCVTYVKACQVRGPDQGGFRYMKQGGPPAFARTAAGVVALYSAGVYKGGEIDEGLKYLLRFKPNQAFPHRDVPDLHYFYGHYYAVQAMWTAGGDYWKQWYPAIRDELIGRAGRHRSSDHAWSDSICSHYATAMACIILQIPNNYLPILQK
jgi:hypothetical protein